MGMSKFEFIATATFGLESVVAKELRNLGYNDLKIENAKVTFKADLSAICRCNLWLRSADRLLIKMGEFSAVTFEELFEGTKALPWENMLPIDANFPVQGKAVKSKLMSVPDCQAIVKKAIVERLKTKYKKEWFEEDGPVFPIEVSLLKDIAVLTIDTSGAGLHKRGYRELASQAPLKETLAAALVQISYWNANRLLIDPLCGSGTIPIEAAMIGKNMAPGINRSFICEKWPWLEDRLWKDARMEAEDSIKRDGDIKILGSDIDGRVLRIARHNATLAGVDDCVFFQKLPVEELRSSKKYGCIICNPPYGQRLGERWEVEGLYRNMGKVFKEFDTWSIYVLTAHEGFERLFGRKASKKRKLYNGRIKVDYYQFFGPPPPFQN